MTDQYETAIGSDGIEYETNRLVGHSIGGPHDHTYDEECIYAESWTAQDKGGAPEISGKG